MPTLTFHNATKLAASVLHVKPGMGREAFASLDLVVTDKDHFGPATTTTKVSLYMLDVELAQRIADAINAVKPALVEVA